MYNYEENQAEGVRCRGTDCDHGVIAAADWVEVKETPADLGGSALVS